MAKRVRDLGVGWENLGQPRVARRPRVGLLITCLVDAMRPRIGFAALAATGTTLPDGVLERIRVTGRWQEIRDRWLSILDSGYGAPQPYYRD